MLGGIFFCPLKLRGGTLSSFTLSLLTPFTAQLTVSDELQADRTPAEKEITVEQALTLLAAYIESLVGALLCLSSVL